MSLRTIKAMADVGGGGGAITAIAIDKDKNSQHALKWAVENIITDSPHCILLHVKQKTSMHLHHHHHHHGYTSRMMPHCHKSESYGESTEDREDDQQEAYHFFLPFRGFCARKGIIAKEVLLHDHDVSGAIVKYLANDNIANIVVGASAHNSLLKRFKQADLATNLVKKAPETCAVFVVSKGRLITSRSANRPRTPRSPHTPKKRANQLNLSVILSDPGPESLNSGETGRTSAVTSGEMIRSALNYRPRPYLSQSDSPNSSRSANSQWEMGSDFSSYSNSMVSMENSYSILENSTTNGSSLTSLSSMSISEAGDVQENLSSNNFLEQQNRVLETEMRRLRHQLQKLNSTLVCLHVDCNIVSLIVSSCNIRNCILQAIHLQEGRADERQWLEEEKQAADSPRALPELEKQKSQAAVQVAEMAQRLAEMEIQKKKLMEMQMKLEERQKTSADYRPLDNRVSYRRYSIKEIEDATECFSDGLKIGEGGYGPVYKAILDHTAVAIKILKSDVSQGLRQFHQEIEVLSCMRHPNMVILLGACPEYGCLVYEYMENGTLEDRLFCKDDTPPLTWRTRFRIAAEIATGLLFLHQAKPEPLVHRDLKPANILLDGHFVSKISDVGLARLVPSSVADSYSHYHMTAAAGTFCYIDPEYQQTGMLGVKSDLYSFGVVLLQILTARPPIGLSHKVEQAIENKRFREILDPNIQDWPIKETLALARLALQCCELRKKDRPDLASGLLPLLDKLRDLALEDQEPDLYRTLCVPLPHDSVPLARIPSSQVSFLEPFSSQGISTAY
ncbi:PREDICTED: U-box domain-containing protein 35-like [Tarenaya hassleriana]|uniref:U-box domain-containing protein 35-like n=1 Tax=Tarenaya hassleriana TaxID=28532 RepID=UPI0008FD2810|nr:PREDICTED: U-box domain-containing protein 35-like [Tarenaya hassleriana]